MKLALKDLVWAVHKGLEKTLPYAAAAVAVLATLLVIVFALLGVEAYVLGDNRWSW